MNPGARAHIDECAEVLQLLTQTSHVAVFRTDVGGRCTFANGSWCRIVGLGREEALGTGWSEHLHQGDRTRVLQRQREAVQDGEPYRMEYRFLRPCGRTVWVLGRGAAYVDEAGVRGGCVEIVADVTESRRASLVLASRNRVLRSLATRATLEEVLRTLAAEAEGVVNGMRCSILLLDEKGERLHAAAGPSLPTFYIDAIDGLEIGPEVGSCGAAAFLRKRVVVEDVRAHTNWVPFRELAKRAGVRACWSEPIFSSDGETLGAFAMYYDEVRTPGDFELEFIQTTARVAGIAIEWRRTQHLEREIVQRKATEQALRNLASERLMAEEKERRRLAVELHDGLNQLLTLARIKLGQLRESDEDPTQAVKEVEGLIGQADEAARSLTFQLSPPVLHDLGLAAAVRWLAEDLYASRGLKVHVDDDRREPKLGERQRVTLFRGIRELLINVGKHSGVDRATVRLRCEGAAVRVTVEDEGRGFDPGAVEVGGVGLFGLRERLHDIGGEVEVTSAPGEGTVVELLSPLGQVEART